MSQQFLLKNIFLKQSVVNKIKPLKKDMSTWGDFKDKWQGRLEKVWKRGAKNEVNLITFMEKYGKKLEAMKGLMA